MLNFVIGISCIIAAFGLVKYRNVIQNWLEKQCYQQPIIMAITGAIIFVSMGIINLNECLWSIGSYIIARSIVNIPSVKNYINQHLG